MEFTGVKRSKNRRKRRHVKKRRRDQLKLEVKALKRTRLPAERRNIFLTTEKLTAKTMQADSFWKNYTVAQEWQRRFYNFYKQRIRHSVTWWRSRCFALEYENQILRDKVRSLASRNMSGGSSTSRKHDYHHREDAEEYVEEERESESKNEKLEFHVNEDMVNFLEQSIRHKLELKKQRESEYLAATRQEKDNEKMGIEGGAAWMQARNKNAKLLYGDASATILAMETALQTTVDRHKDRAKPRHWPVIPLKYNANLLTQPESI